MKAKSFHYPQERIEIMPRQPFPVPFRKAAPHQEKVGAEFGRIGVCLMVLRFLQGAAKPMEDKTEKRR